MIATFIILIFFWMLAFPVAQDWRHPIHWLFFPYTFLVLINLMFGGFEDSNTNLGLIVYVIFFGTIIFSLWVFELTHKNLFRERTKMIIPVPIREYQPSILFKAILLILILMFIDYYIENILSNPIEYFINIRARILSSEVSYPIFFLLVSPLAYVYLSTVSVTNLKSIWILLLVIVLLLLFDLAKTDRSTLKPISMFFASYIVIRGFNFKKLYIPSLIFLFVIIAIGIIRHEPSESETGLMASVFWHFYVDTAGNMSSYFNAINNPFNCGASMIFPFTTIMGAESCERELFFTDIGYFYNTYPGPAYIYSAWGFLGIATFGLIIGLINGIAYRLLFRSISGVSFYGLIVMANIWMFRGFTFGATGFLLALLLTFVAQKFLWKKINPKNNSSVKKNYDRDGAAA